MSERLFDDNATPATFLSRQSPLRQHLRDYRKEIGLHRQVKQDIPGGAESLHRLGEAYFQAFVGLWIIEAARAVHHSLPKFVPNLRIDRLGTKLRQIFP